MQAAVEVTLPTGLWVEGRRRQDAALRPPTGDDEPFLLEEADGLSPARRTTAHLTRCLVRLGPKEPPTADDVRSDLPQGMLDLLVEECPVGQVGEHVVARQVRDLFLR